MDGRRTQPLAGDQMGNSLGAAGLRLCFDFLGFDHVELQISRCLWPSCLVTRWIAAKSRSTVHPLLLMLPRPVQRLYISHRMAKPISPTRFAPEVAPFVCLLLFLFCKLIVESPRLFAAEKHPKNYAKDPRWTYPRRRPLLVHDAPVAKAVDGLPPSRSLSIRVLGLVADPSLIRPSGNPDVASSRISGIAITRVWHILDLR
ncbi:hypothetical protein SCHPADRAFT_150550 [Schizopora paradoxa]|uniref:Uncharacterized protein n=1 Tax=Schizopora paradoxa TaxID=27342 RepID=A0A0H2S7Y4_9AGAM|nr:hypothetical protein SCHPADRAFT_150550 [Schizopora paradoxa]